MNIGIKWFMVTSGLHALKFQLLLTRILQSNINSWLQGRDGHSNICFTNEDYINSSLSRNVDLPLHLIISNCL